MEGLTEGRIVHFVLPGGQHRAAIVVRVGDHGSVNLMVFLDGLNDNQLIGGEQIPWCFSIPYSEDKTPATWHWIEKA